jgi:predicted Fe-Mo cluster-binding NifX family protein
MEISDREILHKNRCDIIASTSLGKIRWFVENQVNILICGAITECLFRELQFLGVTVHGFITGQVEDVIQAFILGDLGEERFAMPGCGNRRRDRGGRRFS